jgi:hypothetical protein
VKDEHEFFDVRALAWTPADGSPGVTERVLAARPDPAAGVIRHAHYEEVYLLEGDLEDLTLGRTFGPGWYASRPPGMPHGPYRTVTGCVMLEIRSPRR